MTNGEAFTGAAPTFAVWCLAFLNAKPTWRKAGDAAEGGYGERHERHALGVDLGLG